MLRSKKVFIGSSVFYAFIDRGHPKHAQAEAFFRYYAQESFQLYTSLPEVISTHENLQKNVGYATARDFLRTVFLGNIEVIYPEESETKNALKLALAGSGSSQAVTFEQALSNTISDKRRIPQIASFDYSQFYFGIEPFTLPY